MTQKVGKSESRETKKVDDGWVDRQVDIYR